MAGTKATEDRPKDNGIAPRLWASKSALCSSWEGERVLDGFASIGRVEAELSKAQDDPMDRPRQFEKARHWFKHHWFIRSIILMRYHFFTFGFAVKSEGPPSLGASASAEATADKSARHSATRVAEWERNNRRMYRRYAREAWLEWLLQDNVVGLWRKAGGRPPLAYPPERCEFSDLFGSETLTINHGVRQEHITTIGAFSRSEQREFQANPMELKLTHDSKVFGFDVLKRERTGSGFGIPTVAPLFVCAAQLQSLEVADAQLAAACRTVMEQHLMGHEIKAGIHAGSKAHFWNKSRAQGFEKSVKGKQGHVRITTNFDHQIKQAANWPDAKVYDAKRYEAGINRMALWAMPLGQMVLGKSLNPFLLPMLKFQAAGEREYLAEHLRQVFIEGLGAPAEIKLVWSNKCFADGRIAADLSKMALAAGPLSQRSFLEEIGADQEEEWDRKEAEGAKSKKLTTPIYDAAHGPPKKGAGRTPGTRDGEGAD